jgi:hypothetical protein
VLLVSVNVQAAAAGSWNYQTETDKMDSSQSKFATIISDNSLNLPFPYQGNNHGQLSIRQRKQDGLNVIVNVQKGQIICTSYNGCQLMIRFDEAQPVKFSAAVPADYSHDTLFIRNEARFVELAKKAKQIRVAVTMYQVGTQVLEFSSAAPLVWELPKQTAQPVAKPQMSSMEFMGECNKRAGDLKGDERKAFMKTCLSDERAKPESKMAMCNKKTAGMKGDERAKAQSECMKG